MKTPKLKTERFLEINDPKKAVGLWSHTITRETTITPVCKQTREALGNFFNMDLARFETHAEALEMMAKKGWSKSASRKMAEYAAQYLGERVDETGKSEWLRAPRWFRAWRFFPKWLDNIKTAKPDKDVRLSFGYQVTGDNCCEENHRTGRVFFLEKNGRHFVAVMLKSGWYGWNIIEKTAYQADPYKRLILSNTYGMKWQTVDADIISELVLNKHLCLFEVEKDPILDALTDPKNTREKLGRLFRMFDFFVHDPNGPHERFYLRWGAIFNADREKYLACDKSNPRLIEVLQERKKEWIKRQILVKDPAEAENAARWVVENNGCAVLPTDASDELRFAVMHALFYVTFPERAIDEPGGILRGYQLPGRMVQHATGPVRGQMNDLIVERVKARADQALDRRRTLIIDTLLDRAVRIVAERNGLDQSEARARIESVNGRAIIETAAWRWGFMEGNALNLFHASPTAGALKLPDLSLAIGFEHRLGLTGGKTSVAKLVQTVRIRTLDEAAGAVREAFERVYRVQRCWRPKPGKGSELIAYSADSTRIILDEHLTYFMAVPKYAQYQYERDLAFNPDDKDKSVPVTAYRVISADRTRTRTDNLVVAEVFDINKVHRLAQQGRIMLYSLNFGADRWLADAVYSPKNKRPCHLATTIPQLHRTDAEGKISNYANNGSGTDVFTDVPASAKEVALQMMFIFNSHIRREPRKYEGRSWKSYCDAYPEDIAHKVIRWPALPLEKAPLEAQTSLNDAIRDVVASDGILLTDDEHLPLALEKMSYVVVQNDDPYAPGGVYNGYSLQDRVFRELDGRVEWRKANAKDNQGDAKSKAAIEEKRKANNGKPLAEVLSAAIVPTAEKEFFEAIEAEQLTDKKTAKIFTLEAPIVIGSEFKEMVAREFRRVAYTGTMGWRRQIVRPAHEVALGIWLARLTPDQTLKERAQTRKGAPSCPFSPKSAHTPASGQKSPTEALGGVNEEIGQ